MGAHLNHLAKAGLNIRMNGPSLRVSPTAAITPELRDYIATHKSAIQEELFLTTDAVRRLEKVVGKLVYDCVRWYREDPDIFEVLTDEQLERCVLDFLARRDWYLQMQGGA